MKAQTQLYIQLGLLAVALIVAGWYFSGLMIYISMAIVLSLIGRPLVELFKKIRYKQFKVGNALAAILALFSIVGFFALIISVVGPLLSDQASLIASIDLGALSRYFGDEIAQINLLIKEYRLLPEGVNLEQYTKDQIDSLVDFQHFSGAASILISATGSLFMGLFTVLFLGFFFLKEPQLIQNAILVVTPHSFEARMREVIEESRALLSRYFTGLFIEVVSMMFILSVLLSLFGIKNAILLGFLGGLFNIIPYLGPIIGATLAALMSVIYVLAYGHFDQLFYNIVVVIGSFSAANVFDNLVLQPVIYSKSVKAHPVEIFLVIIMAGQLAGIAGMIAAIPVYTVIKVIVKAIASRDGFSNATNSTDSA
ncbi:MAG TPA: AI-2E family transporter [Bacteroidales bacterium]|nr:AI-2E family transporter [Bacteroidales bacterium]